MSEPLISKALVKDLAISEIVDGLRDDVAALRQVLRGRKDPSSEALFLSSLELGLEELRRRVG